MWDTYRHGDSDVYLRLWEDGRWGPEIPVTASPAFEANATVVADAMDAFWIAWDRGRADWGKDAPSQRGLETGAYK